MANPIRHYAWGSRTHLPRLLGQDPTEQPAAELWLGAHPGDPSYLDADTSLADAIAHEPRAMLGEPVVAEYGARLPFMMKVLAAAAPLSLQVHPNTERARRGFAREEAAGLPTGHPDRNYQDPFHKPELIFALTRFEGMGGFRDLDRSAAILRLLQLPWLDELAEQLDCSATPFQTLREVVTGLLTLTPDVLTARVGELAVAAEAAEGRGHRVSPRVRPPRADRNSVSRESLRVFATVRTLARAYPSDAGVLVSLLLNHVVLAPGEAMFVDAGVVHAYTSGLGVEILAASDNVVRAGLTPKHTDVPELLQVTDFTPRPAPLWASHDSTPGEARFEPPTGEFALLVGAPPLTRIPAAGPRIVLALTGPVALRSGGAELVLTGGQSAFVADDDGPLSVHGPGRVALAWVPAALA